MYSWSSAVGFGGPAPLPAYVPCPETDGLMPFLWRALASTIGLTSGAIASTRSGRGAGLATFLSSSLPRVWFQN